MKFDIVGRLRNMGLPDGKTAVLYSVYEAVSNSVHAVVDKFGEDDAATEGEIDIDIELDGDGEVDRITVKDNGVGFTPENLSSFETCDSTLKYSRGGKGVGRLIWFKTFENIEVESVYSQGSRTRKISFSFDPMLEDSVQDEGLRQGRPHGDLHIASHRFDEPTGMQVVTGANTAIAIHGRRDGNDPHTVFLGGRNDALGNAIRGRLEGAGFLVTHSTHELAGRDEANICNRGSSGAGVQLELPRTLRDQLRQDSARLQSFSNAIREAIKERPETTPEG